VRSGALGRSVRRVRATARAATPDRRQQLHRSWAALGAGTVTVLLVLGIAVVRAQPPPPLDSVLATGGVQALGTGPGRAADPLVPVAAGADDGSTTASTNPPPPGADPNVTAPGGAIPVAARSKVYAIGDSVMLGARSALTATIPGLTVDAKVGRYMAEGRKLVEFLAAKNQLPDVLVVHLGSNGPASTSDVQDIIKAAGSRTVVLVTVKVPRRWESSSNSAIAEGAADQPNVRIVDWKRLSGSCKGDVFYEDGIHLKPDGATCYANLIKGAL
jgi:hypothetical protein